MLDPLTDPIDILSCLPENESQRRHIVNALQDAIKKGYDPKVDAVIVDHLSSHGHYMVNKIPCLTRSRTAQKGYWCSTRGRVLTLHELLRLQGFRPSRVLPTTVIERHMREMVGNSMAINVLERILVHLLPAAGLVTEELHDRWKSPADKKRIVAELTEQ